MSSGVATLAALANSFPQLVRGFPSERERGRERERESEREKERGRGNASSTY